MDVLSGYYISHLNAIKWICKASNNAFKETEFYIPDPSNIEILTNKITFLPTPDDVTHPIDMSEVPLLLHSLVKRITEDEDSDYPPLHLHPTIPGQWGYHITLARNLVRSTLMVTPQHFVKESGGHKEIKNQIVGSSGLNDCDLEWIPIVSLPTDHNYFKGDKNLAKDGLTNFVGCSISISFDTDSSMTGTAMDESGDQHPIVNNTPVHLWEVKDTTFLPSYRAFSFKLRVTSNKKEAPSTPIRVRILAEYDGVPNDNLNPKFTAFSPQFPVRNGCEEFFEVGFNLCAYLTAAGQVSYGIHEDGDPDRITLNSGYSFREDIYRQ